jgi:hypothetical protein
MNQDKEYHQQGLQLPLDQDEDGWAPAPPTANSDDDEDNDGLYQDMENKPAGVYDDGNADDCVAEVGALGTPVPIPVADIDLTKEWTGAEPVVEVIDLSSDEEDEDTEEVSGSGSVTRRWVRSSPASPPPEERGLAYSDIQAAAGKRNRCQEDLDSESDSDSNANDMIRIPPQVKLQKREPISYHLRTQNRTGPSESGQSSSQT